MLYLSKSPGGQNQEATKWFQSRFKTDKVSLETQLKKMQSRLQTVEPHEQML